MGPFRLDRSSDVAGTSERIIDHFGVIALVKSRGKKIAAGPLLAAAPDMLAALKSVEAIFDAGGRHSSDGLVHQLIRSAIAKAEDRW